MTYDGLLLAGVAAELRGLLVGGKIQKIRQPIGTEVVIEVHSRVGDSRLLLSVDAQYARAHLVSSVTPSPQNPFGFCMALRKHIDGAFVMAIEQPGFERILVFRLESPDGNRTRLIHEIMGKHSNLILVNDEDRVVAAAKVVTAAISKQRQIIPGKDYVSPPSSKVDPLEVSSQDFQSLFSTKGAEVSARDWLVRTFSGMGPFVADEIAARSGQPDDPASLSEQITWLQKTVAGAAFSPVAVTDDRGRITLVYPVDTVQYPADRKFQRNSVNEALDAYYRSHIGSAALDLERSQVLSAVRRAISAREKSLEMLREAIEDGGKADRYKILGDLVTANTALIEKGSSVVTVANYYDPDLASIDIQLEPRLTPRENAERYFKRYQKARDSAVAAADRISETEKEIDRLKATIPEIESRTLVEELRQLRRRLVEKGMLRREQSAEGRGKPAEQPFAGMRIRKTSSIEGWEILVGENSLANDYLTTRVASPNDLWFHARQIKGAHVVVRTNNRPGNVPPGTIRMAAELAAAGSDAKHSSLVPVDYTLRKHVRKPRGSAPGYVIYQNEKTLDVTPDR
jgi:predicted ribosome quality control (RQC) complex YloA/Tae2 family protein